MGETRTAARQQASSTSVMPVFKEWWVAIPLNGDSVLVAHVAEAVALRQLDRRSGGSALEFIST